MRRLRPTLGQGGAPLPGDQTADRLSEDPAEGIGQERLQDPSAGSTDELVVGSLPTDMNVLNKGLVCPLAINPGSISVMNHINQPKYSDFRLENRKCVHSEKISVGRA